MWSIEVAAIQAQVDFEAEMECSLDDFLNKSYEAGADLADIGWIYKAVKNL